MLFSSWLRDSNRSAPAARRRTQTSSRQRARLGPRLEAVEDRCLMSTAVVQTSLVSDDTSFTPAQVQDTNLVNPWGLASGPRGSWFIANEGTGTVTLYNTSHSGARTDSLVVDIPSGTSPTTPGTPTGIVYNSSGGFNVVEQDGKTGASVFLFATVNGTISAWSPSLDRTQAIIEAINPGAIYLGLAMATDGSHTTRLYAADFANGVIDVYGSNFNQVTNLPGSFTDPDLPSDYHPFNIQAIGNRLYVEYAPADDVLAGTAAAGEGAVDVFNADGQLQERLVRPNSPNIDQPWAVAMAPSNFGSFSNDLLVGNFGDATISAFDPRNGYFVDKLKNTKGQTIAITHLWGLAFGNGGGAGPKNALYYTAGLTSHLAQNNIPPHGVFGSLQIAEPQRGGHYRLSESTRAHEHVTKSI